MNSNAVSKKNEINHEKNAIFAEDQIKELSNVFQFFMNPKSKLLNIKDLILSLKTLSYFETNPILISIITKIDKKFSNSDVDFPTFLNEICNTLGDPRELQGRKSMFDLIDRSRNEKVSLEDFKKIIFEINTKVDDQEINEIFIEMSKKKLFFSFEDWDDYIQKQFFLK